MGKLRLQHRVETLQLSEPFRISGYVFEAMDVMVVELDDGEHRGRGEGAGVYYTGDDAPGMVEQIEAHHDALEACSSRLGLRDILPAGGARNAVDCAMWELEAKRAGKTAWQLAGLDEPHPLVTTFTIGADSIDRMAAKALQYAGARAIKIKLTGELELDIARVKAVRETRPDVWIGVDANQGFTIDSLQALVAAMADCKVSLVEQPLARGREADLDGFASAIPLAADESALTLDDVPGLVGRFDVVNIKLDKCGGLTEALMIADAARRHGLAVMVGNMVGTSLAMAPAFILGQQCEIVDLDGPTFLKRDRSPGAIYENGMIRCPDDIWGSRSAA